MHRARSLIIAAFFIILMVGTVVWVNVVPVWQLKLQLERISPVFLKLNFLLIIFAVILNADALRRVLKNVKRSTWIWVLVIVLGGILAAMFIAPQTHRIYYDEDIYLNMGQNMSDLNRMGMCNEGTNLYGEYHCSRLEYNKEPGGWPFLIGLVFSFTGASHLVGFLLNNAIWGLSILVVFLLGFLLFEDERTGLFAALLFAFLPEGLRWSNTTAVEPSAALLAGCAVLSVVFFTKVTDNRSLFLASVLLAFSFQFRPESVMVLLPVSLILILRAPRSLIQHPTHYCILLLFVLSVPHLIHLYAAMGDGWGAPGSNKLSLRFIGENVSVNSLFYFRNIRFPLLTSLLCLIGLGLPRTVYSMNGNKKQLTHVSFISLWREKMALIGWFLAFWGVYLSFYAGSYNYGTDVRFSLMTYIPVAVLSGYGAAIVCGWVEDRFSVDSAKHGLLLLIIFSLIPFLPYVRTIGQEAWAARADHRYADIMANQLPPNSIVLTHNPNMFLLWGKNAAQASIAVNEPITMEHLFDRYEGGIYFHYNFWCNVDDPLQQSFCNRIVDRYETEEVLSFEERNYTYRLYRLNRQGVEG